MKSSFFLIFVGIGLVFLTLTACESNPSEAMKTSPYFDLKAFLEKQAMMLDSLQPLVSKTTMDKAPHVSREISALNWTKELRLFSETSLNRPVYIGQYRIDSLQAPTHQKVVYTAKSEDLATRSMEIYYHQAGQPDSIHVFYRKKNWLYSSERDALLTFRLDAEQQSQLSSYSVEGFQATIFGTRQDYKVLGKLSEPVTE